MLVLRDGAFFSDQLQALAGQGMVARARWGRRETQARRKGGRRRLRPWRIDPFDGPGVSKFELLWLRLPRWLDPGGSCAHQRRGIVRTRKVRRSIGQIIPRERIRP